MEPLKTFSEQYKKLNPEQKKAVDTIEGPVMVIAGPGTGKTQILTLRIAQILLKTQVNPENILALTFTENATAEMKQRLTEILGADALKVTINTFHGFCNELIQKNYDMFHHLASFMPISDLEEVQTIQEIIESESFMYLRPQGDPTYYYNPIRSAISSLKKEGITPQQFVKSITKWQHDFESQDDLIHTKGRYKGKMKGYAVEEMKQIEKNKEFARVFEAYQKKIKEKKLYDYNDMIMEVVHAFKKNDQFLAQMREMYQYILIDEHQDTNNSQNTIIEHLCNLDDYPNLFVVGDEKQSIFRFQGASLENFLYFKKTFPRAVLIPLEKNYRSTQKILDATGALIKHNSHSILEKSNLIAESKHPEVSIELTKYANPYQELFQTAQKIKALHSKGVAFDSMAILVRKNADLPLFAQMLEKNAIPYLLSTEESLFTERTIQTLLTILKAIYFVGDDLYLSRILLVEMFNLDPLDVFRSIKTAQKNKVSLWDFFRDKMLLLSVPFYKKEAILSFVEQIIKWKELSEKISIDAFFITVLNESGLMKNILHTQNALYLLEKFHLLYEDLKQLQRKNHALTLKDYLDYIDLLEEHAIPLQITVSKRKSGSVFVSTAHKSKGLEFEYVFVPKVTESYWGNLRGQGSLIRIPWKYLSRTDFNVEKEDSIEEERRLFYVALTRAKKQIHLSYSSQNDEGKEQVASQFVFEIPTEYIHSKVVEEEPPAALERITSEFSLKKEESSHFKREEMQEYFRSLFLANGVSVSALNNFITCPWRYVFRNLVRLPDVRGYYLLLGTAVHSTIAEYISRLKKHVPLNEKEVVEIFKSSIQNLSASENDLLQLAEKGTLILESYYQKRMKGWDEKRESEIIIPNMHLDTDISINGKIDMIEYKEDNKVVVYDFKTGKSKSRNELLGNTRKANKDYYRQLVFYKLLLSLYKKGQYKMSEGVIEFVESAEKGEIKNETFIIENKDVEELIASIKNMRDSILNLSFWDKRCDDDECQYCQMRDSFYRPLA